MLVFFLFPQLESHAYQSIGNPYKYCSVDAYG